MGAQFLRPPRGNARIAQLMDEFPEVPPILVIKMDLIREGIKPTPIIHKIGQWALPDAHDYFEYDREDTHTAEETGQGYTLTPIVFHFRDDVSVRFMFDSRSPYEVRYEERGRYRLYRDGDPLEEVFFPPRPEWYSKKTSSGRPMSSVISLRDERCMYMGALTYCEYFKENKGCRYCNIVSSEKTKKSLGMDRITAKREQDVYESFVAASQEGQIRHAGVSGGVLLDSSKEADNYARLVRSLKRAMKDVGYECPIRVTSQALAREDQLKLKEAGVTNIAFSLEVWDPKLFSIICPGKSKYVGQETWKERMLHAVEIWGITTSAFVLGVEMAPPYGFKTEDEAAESTLQGWEWLMAHRIMPHPSPWRCAPGTEFAGMSSPRTEYFLRMELARHKMAHKYNLVPQGCNRCYGSLIVRDWGCLEAAGPGFSAD